MQWGGGGKGEGREGENRVQKEVDSRFPTHPLSPFPCLHVDYFIGKEQKF